MKAQNRTVAKLAIETNFPPLPQMILPISQQKQLEQWYQDLRVVLVQIQENVRAALEET